VDIARTRHLPRAAALAAAASLAGDQDGIVGRGQLSEHGVPRWVLQAELRARRWRRTGRQTLAVHRGPVDAAARRWIAVLEVGPRAAIDGVTVLQHAGCDLDDRAVWVIVPKGSRPRPAKGVRVKESRRYDDAVILRNGIPRGAAAVAAVHAALWARTDREASYLLLLVIQRRLATVAEVQDAVGAVRRHRRRKLLTALVRDLAGGVRSLGELDVAGDFRRRGLPEPDRQVLRRRPSGTEYLDCVFDAYQVSLEIDGAGHDDPLQRLSDLLRDIRTAAHGHTAVRLPLATYRLGRESVLDAVEDLLRSRGWGAAQAS
jgi:very-short-patch-repair endonuclease